jgi:hypothetical protein
MMLNNNLLLPVIYALSTSVARFSIKTCLSFAGLALSSLFRAMY